MTTALLPGVLAGVRVLDLSRVLAGPWCGQLLADLGAEVIKVERPGVGDDTRAWGPPFAARADGAASQESAYYLCANRGKRSVTVNLSDPEGQRLARELASQCDVLIENFKVGDLTRYGLGYEQLHALYPRLIYCSITGFGQTGPYAQRPGYDYIIQGMSGLMSVTGERDGQPGAGPQKVGVAVADLFTGIYSALAIVGALYQRHSTGRGQYIDMALFDTQVAMLANQNMAYLVGGQVPQRLGNAHPNIVPYQVFAVADGHLILAVGNDTQFRAFCAVAGHPEWGEDARFATNPARVAHRDTLTELIAPVMQTQKRDAWLPQLEAAGVPCGPINTLEQVFADPQIQHRGVRFDVPHSTCGSVPMVRTPIRYSDSALTDQQAPPTLGEHTAQVLGEYLGLSGEQLVDLKQRGVV